MKRHTTTAVQIFSTLLVVAIAVPLALAGVLIATPVALGRSLAVLFRGWRGLALAFLLASSCAPHRDRDELPAPCPGAR